MLSLASSPFPDQAQNQNKTVQEIEHKSKNRTKRQ